MFSSPDVENSGDGSGQRKLYNTPCSSFHGGVAQCIPCWAPVPALRRCADAPPLTRSRSELLSARNRPPPFRPILKPDPSPFDASSVRSATYRRGFGICALSIYMVGYLPPVVFIASSAACRTPPYLSTIGIFYVQMGNRGAKGG